MNDTHAVPNDRNWNEVFETSNDNNVHDVHADSPLKKRLIACIIIPTFNEAKNILLLLNAIYSDEQRIAYRREKIEFIVLVVDDNSPDGTAYLIKNYQVNNKNVHLLERKVKNGLGSAYVDGMKHAMQNLHPDIIFEMDGDLSHNPKYLLSMVMKIREGADFVIGSRYVEGGSIPDDWGIMRKQISRIANTYAKTMLSIKSVNDCTGGFRCMRVSKLEEINLDALGTKGYAFQISLLEEMRRRNATMREVPIHFEDRTMGKSKMRFYDILEEGFFVFKTRVHNIFGRRKIPANTKTDARALDIDIKN